VRHANRALPRMPISHGEDAASLAPEGSDPHSPDVLAEQIEFLYRQFPSGAIPGAVGAALLGSAAINSRPTLIAWLAALYAILIARTLLYIRFRSSEIPIEQSRKWGNWFAVGSAVTGIAWGCGTLLMFTPDSTPLLAFLFIALFALSIGAVLIDGYYLRAFYAFVIPVWLPLIVRSGIEPGSYYFFIAAVGAVFLGALLWFGRTQNQLFVSSVRGRYANLELIREMKEQKAVAERAREEAIVASRSKSQFLAAASHDLRQPLQALRLFTEALNEKIYYPEVRSIVNNINSSVEALEMLFNELLDISKLDAGAIVPKLSNFPINTMLDQIRTDFTPQAAEKRLKLRVVPSNAVLYSDPTLLVRVLRNFVANAIRYTGEKGSVLVVCRRRGDGRIRIEVRDNGIGVAPEQQKKIFDEFYQVSNPERDRRKGLGLGLAIVKRIQGLIDCRVALRSAPGRGSVFSATLPRGQLVPMANDGAPEPQRIRTNMAGFCIAVIEDTAAVREGLKVLLKEWGAEVVAVSHADQAIEAVQKLNMPLHLIIADYRLEEEVTGMEAIEQVRRGLGAEIPAMLLSGDTAPELLKAVQKTGYQLLHKPVAPAKLRAAITALLKQPRRDGSAALETPEKAQIGS
jgi:two-component system, sensor histidine kinase